MTVLLDPNLPFEELLVAIAKKFKDSARFWGAVQMTLTLEGRRLTPEEEMAVVNTITENSQIDVLCLLDTDAQRIERCEKKRRKRNVRKQSVFRKTALQRMDSFTVEHSAGEIPWNQSPAL